MIRITLTRKDTLREEDVILTPKMLNMQDICNLAKTYIDFFTKVKVELF